MTLLEIFLEKLNLHLNWHFLDELFLRNLCTKLYFSIFCVNNWIDDYIDFESKEASYISKFLLIVFRKVDDIFIVIIVDASLALFRHDTVVLVEQIFIPATLPATDWITVIWLILVRAYL